MRFRHKVMWAVGSITVTVLGLVAINTLVAPDETVVHGSTTGFSTVATDAPPDEAPPNDVSWPEYGYNSQATRFNPTLADLGIPGKQRWQVNAGSLVEFPPVIDNGIAIVGTNHQRVMAIDVRTGHRKWQFFTKGRIASSPAIADGVAFLTTTEGYLIARRITDGDKLWETKIGSSSETSPTIVGNAMFVATLDGHVMRFDLQGNEIWRTKVRGQVKSAAAVYKDTILVGDYSGHLTSIAQATGKRIWSVSSPGRTFRGSGRFYAGPAIQYGRVYIGNVNGRFMAFSAETGKLAWLRSFGTGCIQVPRSPIAPSSWEVTTTTSMHSTPPVATCAGRSTRVRGSAARRVSSAAPSTSRHSAARRPPPAHTVSTSRRDARSGPSPTVATARRSPSAPRS